VDQPHPPDERSRVLRELEAHLQGRTERFEIEHRLRHRDGSWRVVLARASAVRHASGKASRLVGLMTDISARKRVQEALIDLAEGLSNARGETCFRELVRSFAQVLGVKEVFVCECVGSPTTRVRMLARWKGGDYAHCAQFDLQGTACQDVIVNGAVVYVPQNAGERWPLERQYERDAYLGLPCFDSAGRIIGHIACADPVSMPPDLPHEAILKLFALRASIELERRRFARPHHAPAGLSAAQVR
jgi:GAF domain-containing protein